MNLVTPAPKFCTAVVFDFPWANDISPQLESWRDREYRTIATLSKIKKTLRHNSPTVITQLDRVVSASDSQPGCPGFEIRSGDLFYLFSVIPC